MRMSFVTFFFLGLTGLALAQEQDSTKGSATPKDSVLAVQAAPVLKLSPAELRAEQLDRLFGSLQAQTGLRDPKKTEASIWELWSQSDSATADLLLRQSGRALSDEEPIIAEAFLNTMIEKYPDYAEAYNKRATLYFRMRRYNDSLRDIDKVLELEPRHFGALSGRGMILREQGKTKEAIKALKDALSINPSMQTVSETVKLMEKQEPGI